MFGFKIKGVTFDLPSKRNMKTIEIKGITYDNICIIDGNIVCQSLKQDLVFENGYTIICDQLTDEWRKQGSIASSRDYVLEYENEAILEYVRENEGVVQVNNLN